MSTVRLTRDTSNDTSYYNAKLKSQFIEDYSKERAKLTVWRSLFLPAATLEELYDKDLCNFTFDEIGELLTLYRASSVNSLNIKKSILTTYTDYCIDKGLSIDGINHYREMPKSRLEDYIDKKKAEYIFFTEEKIQEILSKLNSYRDQFLILALYNGICGKDFIEIIELKNSDLKGNCRVWIKSRGEEIEVPEQLYEIMEGARDEKIIYASDGRTGRLEGNTIFKLLNNGRTLPKLHPGAINKRLFNMKSILELPMLGAKAIMLSGFCNQFSKLEAEKGSYDAAFLSEECDELKKIYLMPKHDSAIKQLYKEYSDYLETQKVLV